MVFNTLFGNHLVYTLIGIANRLHPDRPIRTLFVFYSVNQAYLDTMIYRWYAPLVRWTPGLGQVIKQGKYWGLSFGITSSEADFLEPDNQRRLKKLHDKMRHIGHLIGAEQVTYSGILPGVFLKRGIRSVDECPEIRNTATVVVASVEKLVTEARLPTDCPVVVAGGKGTIGSLVVGRLREANRRSVFSIDISEDSGVLTELRNRPIIFLNITRPGVLRTYTARLWKEAVVLNEVYPEPKEFELAELRCWHISGVRGCALPRFQRAYSGAIPCCAAYLVGNDVDTILVRCR